MEDVSRARNNGAKLCPSAQPGMEECRVLGVVQHDGPKPMLLYLSQPLPATPDVLAMAAPVRMGLSR